MEAKKPKITIFTILGIVIALMFACDTPKSCGKSKEENLQDYQATTFYGSRTQTALAMPHMLYPLMFKGLGTYQSNCPQVQEAEITFFVADGASCHVGVAYPVACEGPLSVSKGLSFVIRGTVTERDSEPSYCELTICNSGEASGKVYFTQTEMVMDSSLVCSGRIVEFGPLVIQEGSAAP